MLSKYESAEDIARDERDGGRASSSRETSDDVIYPPAHFSDRFLSTRRVDEN